jgi:anaerobic selenocysteine-containing dehydrogenase
VAQIQAVYDYNRIKTPLRRTNRKGEPGRFVQISWDEALSTVANELRDSSTKGTPVLWQKGRSKAKKFYDTAFVNTLKNAGIPTAKFGHGAYCSDSGYRACEYNLGLHGVLHPDFRHVKYLLSWGWGLTTSGGNKYCWLTWPQFFQEARANNLKKVVAFDPFRRGTGPHADEWLAPKPGTDTAFFLGLSHYLLTNGFLDRVYLRDHTNSPFLVKADGMFARRDVGGEMKELVWDTATDQAVPFDTAGAVPALDGEYDVDGEMVKPSLERLKDLLVSNGWTPDWADGVCGLPALTTARIARELYENAHIGETITIEGTTFPYRPVAIMGYHVTQQELGFTACRAAIQVFMLLGAIDVPGGLGVDFAPGKAYKNWTKLNEISIKEDNLDFSLGGSKFFPISSTNPSFIARTMLEPTRYDVDDSTIPNKMILFMADPITSFTDIPVIKAAYSKLDFVAAITPWLSNTAASSCRRPPSRSTRGPSACRRPTRRPKRSGLPRSPRCGNRGATSRSTWTSARRRVTSPGRAATSRRSTTHSGCR